jgi:hypothetical protein
MLIGIVIVFVIGFVIDIWEWEVFENHLEIVVIDLAN